MSEIIRCADVAAGDFIRIGRLLFHVKHTQPGQDGKVLVQAERLEPPPEGHKPIRTKWLTWRADATVQREPAPEPAREMAA